jgi:hypothetical protein
VQTRKAQNKKNGCYLAADYYCYPLLSSLLQPYFAAKDKENKTNDIILDNSFSMQKGKQGDY